MGARRRPVAGVLTIALVVVAAVGCASTTPTDGVATGGTGSSTEVGTTDGPAGEGGGEAPSTTCVTIPVTTIPGVPSDEEGACDPAGDAPSVPDGQEADDGSRTIITMLSPKGDARWPASTGITDAARATLAAAYEGADGALLVPPPGRWPDPTVVEARVDGYAPDPGYVSMNVVVREVAVGIPVVTIAGASALAGSPGTRACAADGTADPSARTVRGMEGCVSSNGTIAFVWWTEAGNRFQAESATLDADALVAELADWQLLPAADL